ncbi:hydroxymethylglutaryl-CoA lyase [Aeromicrobium sp. YIM 150415]|uniref:hydroxymethylglutaryl-CoA lyase n=1 Tax=Aeromicrobium sp. YIM 150415 TaxID=2803912 RepID=UPI0019666D99|nr:hydroxymethylglutaryl-CoA lyase [Aeromicrobium sp. YIM 150415]MBM9462172.1 hydroxymethylglutaryl-CoA lyase [Aeromicrobium sp. YIM 150415]
MSGRHPTVHRDPALPRRVTVYEVGARDGLQAESALVPSTAKIDFISRLRAAGLPWVEATSFVSSRRIPQLADAAEVLAGLGTDLEAHPVLVPNLRGLERARAAGARTIAVFVSATESFARRNLNAGRDDSLETARRVVEEASGEGMRVRGYVSMCFGDPWEGEVAVDEVASVSRSLLDSGCAEISLGDTIGVGTAGHVAELVAAHGRAGIGPELLALHFHDTYGQALANVAAGLRSGVACFDASAGGIGGCPFAGSATGNLATEDLLWMLSGLGIETGVDLDEVVAAGAMMTDLLGRPRSRVATALLG